MMADSLLVGRVLFCHGCLWSPECPRAAGNTLSGRATFSCGSWLFILESAGIGTGLLVDSYAPDDNRLEGALQNVACKHQCLCGRKSFKKMADSSVSIPKRSLICLLPLQKSLQIGRLFDPGSYQTTAFVLGLSM